MVTRGNENCEHALSFQASPTGAQWHKMSQSACFAHVVQWVHVGTVDSMRARNGSGQIQLMGAGCYRVRISAGYDPVTGKRRQPSKVVHGTRQDAERVRAELLLRPGHNRDPGPEITSGGGPPRWSPGKTAQLVDSQRPSGHHHGTESHETGPRHRPGEVA